MTENIDVYNLEISNEKSPLNSSKIHVFSEFPKPCIYPSESLGVLGSQNGYYLESRKVGYEKSKLKPVLNKEVHQSTPTQPTIDRYSTYVKVKKLDFCKKENLVKSGSKKEISVTPKINKNSVKWLLNKLLINNWPYTHNCNTPKVNNILSKLTTRVRAGLSESERTAFWKAIVSTDYAKKMTFPKKVKRTKYDSEILNDVLRTPLPLGIDKMHAQRDLISILK